MAERVIELKYKISGKDEYAADIAAINKITESTEKKAKEAASNVSASFQNAGKKMIGAFQIDQIDKSLSKVESSANDLKLEIVSVFDSAEKSGNKLAVNLKDVEEGLKANAAAAIKFKSELTEISPNIAKPVPSNFNPQSQLVPGTQVTIEPPTAEINSNTAAKQKNAVETKKLSDNTRTLSNELFVLKDQILKGVYKGEDLAKAKKEAAGLQVEIKKLDQQIKVIGSDTSGIDAVVSGARGIAAGFTFAAGAIGLFSDDADKATLVTQKIQGALALLTGVQELSKIATNRQTLSIGGLTIAERANMIATVAATKVQQLFGIQTNVTATSFKVLRTAILGLGIAGLVALIYSVVSAFTEADEKVDKFTDTLKDSMKDAVSSVQDAYKRLLNAKLEYLTISGQITETEKSRRDIQNETDAAIEASYKREAEAIKEISKLEKQRMEDADAWWKSNLSVEREQAKIREDTEEKITDLVSAGNEERKRITEAGELRIQSVQIKNATELEKYRVDLSKKRLQSEIAADRAKFELAVALTEKGSRLENLAIIKLNEFELDATKKLLAQELKERKLALKESGVATKKDYAALNNEINSRRLLAEGQTKAKITQLDEDYFKEYLKDYETFQREIARLREEGIKATNEANLAAYNIAAMREIEARERNSNPLSDKNLKAKIDKIKQRSKEELEEIDAREKEETKKLFKGSEERLAIENKYNELRKTNAVNTLNEIEDAEKEHRKRLNELIIESAASVIQELTSMEQALYERRIKQIDKQAEHDIKTANATAAQKLRIQEIADAKTKALKRKQAEAEKRGAIFNIILGTAAAIVKEGIVTPTAILAGVLGAIQLATAVATPIPEFGEGGEIKGDPHSKGGVNINAEGGEYMIRKQMFSQLPEAAKNLNKSKKAFEDWVFKTYIRPELLADRIRSGVDSGRSVGSQKERAIEVRTARLERELSRTRRQASSDADRIIFSIERERSHVRSIW